MSHMRQRLVFGTLGTGVQARLRKWRGFLLLAWMSSRPQAALSGELDDAIARKGQSTPFYSLKASQGVLTNDSLSNFTCVAVTSADVSFSWSLDGKPLDEAFTGEPLRVPIHFTVSTTHSSPCPLSDAHANPTVAAPASHAASNCLRRIPAAFRLSATVRAGVERLHSGFGDRCPSPDPSSVRVAVRECVGEGLVCSTRPLGEGLCLCDPYEAVRYDELRACLLRKKLGDACLVDEQCDERNQRCYHNHCTCQDSFELRERTCSQNASLNGICDAFRLCPEGSACTDNLCKCAEGFYSWGGSCQKRLLSESQGKAAIVGILAVVHFGGGAVPRLPWHSTSTATRAGPRSWSNAPGSSWDFFPTATTLKKDSL
ncbi:hypothetical protein MRX96_023626 [Rhipicephalus microplus]